MKSLIDRISRRMWTPKSKHVLDLLEVKKLLAQVAMIPAGQPLPEKLRDEVRGRLLRADLSPVPLRSLDESVRYLEDAHADRIAGVLS